MRRSTLSREQSQKSKSEHGSEASQIGAQEIASECGAFVSQEQSSTPAQRNGFRSKKRRGLARRQIRRLNSQRQKVRVGTSVPE